MTSFFFARLPSTGPATFNNQLLLVEVYDMTVSVLITADNVVLVVSF